MSKKYKAIIKDSHIYWEGEQPSADRSIAVQITVISEEKETREKKVGMADLLEKLAQKKAFSTISDPVQWQENMRRDRSILF